ncbi:MAG: TonB-dependent receptor [Halieaceae bacterium]|nr:TonB-dependent receptor [Halieaceae bacterium]
MRIKANNMKHSATPCDVVTGPGKFLLNHFIKPCIIGSAVLAWSAQTAAQLEEVVVTAQKRDQNLQEVPLAVSAFMNEDVRQVGANNIERLDAITPGLEWGQFGLGARVSIRGQGVANFEANTDGPVGLFVDGIYLGRGQQAWTSITDVERVEITRGPQGTLFGRNTTGGSINIVPKKPSTEDVEAGIDLNLFDYSGREVSGFVNIPLSDTVAVRFTGFYEKHDGFIENQFDDDNSYLDEDMTYIRGAARFTPSDRFTFDFSAEYWDQSGNGAAFSGVNFFDQDAPQINTWSGALSGVPDLPANGGNNNDWEINQDGESTRDISSSIVVATVQYDFDNFSIKSVTGYSDYDQYAGGDSDFSTLALADLSLDTQAELFTQEIQLTSIGDSPLEWIAGFYYLDETIDELFRFNFLLGGFDFSTRDGTSDTTSWAVYADAIYNLSESFAIFGGIRYTEDDRSYKSSDSARADTRGEVDASETFDEPTWRVGVQYFPREGMQLYALVSTGYKAGGFNRYRPPTDGSLNYNLTFEPETIVNYEAGLKGDFADGTLRTNLSVFYNEIDEFQAYAFDNSLPSSITTNAATAETWGVELESTWAPTDQSRFQVIAAHLDASYDSYQAFSNGSVNIDASGNTRELSPEWKVTLVAQYDFDLGDAGTLTPYIQSTYKSSYFVTASNESNGLDEEASYTQTDLRLLWTASNEQLSIEGYLTNIEDNYVKTGGFLATNGYWITYGPEPRIFGVRASYRF